MKKIYYTVRLFFNLFRVARNPKNTPAALDIGKCLRGMGLLGIEILKHQNYRDNIEFINQRRLLPHYDLQDLKKLPEGTLGHAYANHMLSHGLDPDFYDKIPITDDVAYIMMRMRETHDLWHIITGFDTSVQGELGLQAFMFAQVRTPLAPILIAGRTLVSTFKNPEEVPLIYDQVTKGWKMGLQAKQIFSYEWEKNWSVPLADVRSDQKIS